MFDLVNYGDIVIKKPENPEKPENPDEYFNESEIYDFIINIK